jgi:hypothetical protein
MTQSLDIAQLSQLIAQGIGVAPDYRHEPKEVAPNDVVQTRTALLKWYDIHPLAQPIPIGISALARAAVESGRLAMHGLGFVVLHRCGEDFYFLIACSWRNENELWETIWYKNGDAMEDFAVFPRDPAHLPTYCVWELVPIWHEQQVWSRFLSTDRGLNSIIEWSEQRYCGSAG